MFYNSVTMAKKKPKKPTPKSDIEAWFESFDFGNTAEEFKRNTEEFKRNTKNMFASFANRFDLVTRKEFEASQLALHQAMKKLEAIEKKLGIKPAAKAKAAPKKKKATKKK